MEKRQKQTGKQADVSLLPALSSLKQLPTFFDLCPSDEVLRFFSEKRICDAALELAAVVRLDRGFPALASESGLYRAEFAAKLSKSDYSKLAVGDYVAASHLASHDMGIVEEILPRKSEIVRWRGSTRGEMQTLAANVDTVIIVAAISREGMDYLRIARSVLIVRDCKCKAVLVITKADRASELELSKINNKLDELFGGELTRIFTSSFEGEGIDAVRELVPAQSVAIMLGESGAGKSSLLNALVGSELLETGEVRARDDMGRHTTVTRRMVKIPDAGVIVDAPGLRSLPLLGHERGLALSFPSIAEAAATCKFRDCTHTREPGCAVQAGLSEELFPEAQVKLYVRLADEMREHAQTLDADIIL